MTQETMISKYSQLSAATSYVLGFTFNHILYMVEIPELNDNFFHMEKQSEKNGGGYSLRVRLNKAMKKELVKTGAEKIGMDTDLKDSKYNKGETFEKIVTEKYGLKWEKDNVPFYVCGDISINGKEIQVKLEGATMCSEKSLTNAMKKMAAAA